MTLQTLRIHCLGYHHTHPPTWDPERSCQVRFAVVSHIGTGVIVDIMCDRQSAGDDKDAVAVFCLAALRAVCQLWPHELVIAPSHMGQWEALGLAGKLHLLFT